MSRDFGCVMFTIAAQDCFFKKRLPTCGYEISRELTTPTPLPHRHKSSPKITFSPVGENL